MANLCFTQYRFHGSQADLSHFRDKLVEWTKWDETGNWDCRTLTNVLECAGLQDRVLTSESPSAEEPEHEDKLMCKGVVSHIEDFATAEGSREYVEIYTETAWIPMPEMWQAVIAKLGIDIKFAYLATEDCNSVHTLYDPEGYGDFDTCEYYLDFDIVDESAELRNRFSSCKINEEAGGYYLTTNVITEWLQALLQTNESDIAKLSEQARDYPFSNDTSYVIVSKVLRK